MKEAIYNLLPEYIRNEGGGISPTGVLILLGLCAVLFLVFGLISGALVFRFGRKAVVVVENENLKLSNGLEMYRATVEKQTYSQEADWPHF